MGGGEGQVSTLVDRLAIGHGDCGNQSNMMATDPLLDDQPVHRCVDQPRVTSPRALTSPQADLERISLRSERIRHLSEVKSPAASPGNT